MSMESVDIYMESYNTLNTIQKCIDTVETIGIPYNLMDSKSASWLRDRIRNYLSTITDMYQKRRGERDFVKDDYMEFIDHMERQNTMDKIIIDFTKMQPKHACELRALIKETVNVRKINVWKVIQGGYTPIDRNGCMC